jgi:low affinity Fe/Cu permease
MAKRSAKRKSPSSKGPPASRPDWTMSTLFSSFAVAVAHWSGKPLAFIIAVTAVVIWAATGPIFGFSDTWQLVINTSTTIITFLMVFLIQSTQNRDTLALQIKLAELIHAVGAAKDSLAAAEDMTDEELEQLHTEYRELASSALGHLERRRTAGASG